MQKVYTLRISPAENITLALNARNYEAFLKSPTSFLRKTTLKTENYRDCKFFTLAEHGIWSDQPRWMTDFIQEQYIDVSDGKVPPRNARALSIKMQYQCFLAKLEHNRLTFEEPLHPPPINWARSGCVNRPERFSKNVKKLGGDGGVSQLPEWLLQT
jgi:hypothetical protein